MSVLPVAPLRGDRTYAAMPWIRTCAVAAALVWAPALAAQKTDTVELRNGNRITGEIKSLSRGALSYSTDDMGTLAIEWDNVVRLTSRRYFEVEVTTGRRYYGMLTPASQAGFLVVEATVIVDTLPGPAVVRIHPLGASFISRVDGYVDIGFTFQLANNVRQLSAAIGAEHRSQRWRNQLKGSSYFQNQDDVDGTSRNNVSLATQRLFSDRWSGIASFGLEQNQELDLLLRSSLAAVAGRFLRQTNYTIILVGAGLTYTHESFLTGEETNNLETVFSGEFDFFRKDAPNTDIRVALKAYPSLSNFGRVRLNFDARAARELFKDFTLSLTFFDTFDSRPPSATASKNDFGTTLSIGWTF